MNIKTLITVAVALAIGFVFGYIAKGPVEQKTQLSHKMKKGTAHKAPVRKTGSSPLPDKIKNGGRLMVNLSRNPGRSLFPKITKDKDNNLFVSWIDQVSGKPEINMKKQTGTGWSDIPSDKLYKGLSLSTSIAVDSKKNINLAFMGKRNDDYLVYYSQNKDGKWSSPINLSKNMDASYAPKIVVDAEDNLHLVWHVAFGHNAAVFYLKNTKGVWSEKFLLSVKKKDSTDWMPNIALDKNGGVHVVYYSMSKEGTSVYYIKKEPGSDWGDTEKVSGEMKFPIRPNIVVDSKGAPHIFWLAGDNKTQDIHYTYRVNNKWAPPVNLTKSGRKSNDMGLAVDNDGAIHMVWSENLEKAQQDVFYMKGAGDSWTTMKNITETKNASNGPQIVIDKNGSANIVWFEMVGARQSDVFYTRLK